MRRLWRCTVADPDLSIEHLVTRFVPAAARDGQVRQGCVYWGEEQHLETGGGRRAEMARLQTERDNLHPHPRVTAEWGFDRSAEVKFCKQPFTTPKK